MMDVRSPSGFRAAVTDGLLKIWDLQGASFTAIHATVLPDGAVRTDRVEQLPQPGNPPICKATYAGDRRVHVDLNCGAQRWNGVKTLAFLRKGLSRAGFERQDINLLFKDLKAAGPSDDCPREW